MKHNTYNEDDHNQYYSVHVKLIKSPQCIKHTLRLEMFGEMECQAGIKDDDVTGYKL